MSYEFEHLSRTIPDGDEVFTWTCFPAGNGYIAAYRTVPFEGDTVVIELRLFPGDHHAAHRHLSDPQPARPFDTSKPLTARLVRDLPFIDHMTRIKSDVMTDDDYSPEIATAYSWLGYVDVLLKTPARTGRRGPGIRVLLGVAIVYAAAVERTPNTAMKETHRALTARGFRYSRARIETFVAQAREYDLLTRSPAKGKAGGRLTSQALEARIRLLGE